MQEAEERHRQALWADEGTNGASFIDENEQEEGGGVTGNDELQDLPTWRLVLRRLVDHVKFQVRYQANHFLRSRSGTRMGGREEGGPSVRAMTKEHAPRYRDAIDPLERIPRCSRGVEHPTLAVGGFRVTSLSTSSTFSVVYGRWQVVTDS